MSEVFKCTRCPLCPSTALTREKLSQHIVACHRDKKYDIVLKCYLCQEGLNSYESLITHRREKHRSIQKELFNLDEDNQSKLFYETLLLECGRRCPLEETLQFKAAEFLHNLNKQTSQDVIDSVIKESNVLFEIFIDLVQSKISQVATNSNSQSLSLEVIFKTLENFKNNSVFEGLQTPKLYEKYLVEKKWMVPPTLVDIKKSQVLRKNQSVDLLKLHFGYKVLFFPLLERLLNLPEVLSCIDNPKVTEKDTFASPLDGYYYQNHPVVLNDSGQTLAFGTYVDDARLTDTASSKPLDGRFFYWTLLNLYPELRSSTRAINLLFCAQTDIVKTYGFDDFLADYIFGIKKLSSDDGVIFDVKGEKRKFHGIHLFSSGDNPASAELGGFKESHFAELLCRQCMGTKPAIYQSFVESDFTLRSKASHQNHVEEIEAYRKLPKSQQEKTKNPSVAYGVNKRSVLMQIEIFDVTKQLPQDLMHDVIHGTLKLEIICLLNHVLIEKKSLTVHEINNRKQKYSKYFGVNKPSAIELGHIQNKNLRQSAAETLAFAHMLPFILIENEDLSRGVTSVCEEEKLKCFILRLNLLDLQMATQFTVQDVDKLRKMTKTHHDLLLKCYPGVEIPKLHFEIHLGTQILLFGPLRQHWCFRFEGKHAEFKRIWRLCHNSKNVYLTLATRHQSRQGGQMMFSAEGETGPFLQVANDSSVPQPIKSRELKTEIQQLLHKGFNELPSSLHKYKYIVHASVHYAPGDAFVMDFVNAVPIVGEIVEIYGHKDLLLFTYAKMITEKYDQNLNAFKVKHSGEIGVASISNIVHHQSVPYIRSLNAHYVVITCQSFLSTLLQP